MKHQTVTIKWTDSYGVDSGWKDVSDYSAVPLTVTSYGKIIYEDDKVVALAHNYAEATDNTCEQANGIMVIPLACVVSITTFS
jgi:hypothetical protein